MAWARWWWIQSTWRQVAGVPSPALTDGWLTRDVRHWSIALTPSSKNFTLRPFGEAAGRRPNGTRLDGGSPALHVRSCIPAIDVRCKGWLGPRRRIRLSAVVVQAAVEIPAD